MRFLWNKLFGRSRRNERNEWTPAAIAQVLRKSPGWQIAANGNGVLLTDHVAARIEKMLEHIDWSTQQCDACKCALAQAHPYKAFVDPAETVRFLIDEANRRDAEMVQMHSLIERLPLSIEGVRTAVNDVVWVIYRDNVRVFDTYVQFLLWRAVHPDYCGGFYARRPILPPIAK